MPWSDEMAVGAHTMTITQFTPIIVVVLAALAATPQLPRVASPAEAASQRGRLEAAVADCERMWDRGTHMTKKEWSRTCRRVQNRIQQFEQR
jgi:hypothetical protein